MTHSSLGARASPNVLPSLHLAAFYYWPVRRGAVTSRHSPLLRLEGFCQLSKFKSRQRVSGRFVQQLRHRRVCGSEKEPLTEMSLQVVNDENAGESAVESRDFLLSPPQPTGRPSILRPSQKDNLPPKDAAKSIKVTFQTPMRDPLTRKIIAPSVANNPEIIALEHCMQALEQLHLFTPVTTCSSWSGDSGTRSIASASDQIDDETPVRSMGGYNIDFDNLDNVNPFKNTNQMQNSPVKPECSPTKDGDAEVLPDVAADNACNSDSQVNALTTSVSHLDSPVTIRLDDEILNKSEKTTLLEDTIPLSTVDTDTAPIDTQGGESINNGEELPACDMDVCPLKDNTGANVLHAPDPESNMDSVKPDVQSSPPVPEVSYKFDPDQIDMIDPFKTGGSKLQNSPVKPVSEDVTVSSAEPVTLEFNVGDGDPPVKKPPLKKLGKRPTLTSSKKPSGNTDKVAEKPKVESVVKPPEEEAIVPKVAYNFDWEKFDDPNFNPFGCGGSKISSSPKGSSVKDAEPINEDCLPPVECTDPVKPDPPASGDAELVAAPQAVETVAEDNVDADLQSETRVEDEATLPARYVMEASISDDKPDSGADLMASNEAALDFLNKAEFLDLEFKPAEGNDFMLSEEMDFKPATDLFPAGEILGQSAEMDYLESFGSSSFKESVLRKQSLYLKFDPLLRESPTKSAVAAGGDLCLHAATRSSADLFGTMSNPIYPIPCHETEEKPEGLDLLGTFPVLNAGPLIPDPPSCVSASDPYPLISDVGSIVEVLKYSQKDMEAAIENVRLEVQEKEFEVLEWKHRHEKLYLEYNEMGKIVAEFENTITQMLEESQRQKEMTKQELQRVLEEKQQVQLDLNSMEKTLSELFKRFEKQKEVIDGYRKNEESLKKCVEDYHARIKKEEQRYQALKAHAEEKLNRANEEIAQVRSKAKSETVVSQVTVRKDQMKIQSLERALEQKTKENDELTKICDDLIMKMEKI
uniref:Transforming acidic coiled-coil containing protein 3 n=2 Tax=Leptobrachium leishanense TaxID=445787 RepID=A0A8C5LUN6_9ANUR